MSQEEKDATIDPEKPIIVDRYVRGMAMPLALAGMGARASVHEKGGVVYVDNAVREKAKAILREHGFSVAEDEDA